MTNDFLIQVKNFTLINKRKDIFLRCVFGAAKRCYYPLDE